MRQHVPYAHCRALIAGYKCPRSIEFRSTLPMSALDVLGRQMTEEIARVPDSRKTFGGVAVRPWRSTVRLYAFSAEASLFVSVKPPADQVAKWKKEALFPVVNL